jgi:tetratricopeptide (TPR) repeat protein
VKLAFGILLSVSLAMTGQAPPPSFDDLSRSAQQAYQAGHEDEAAQLYAEAVKMQPEWAEGWWALGLIDYEHDRYPQCRDALTKMVSLDASAVPGWAILGLCEFQTGQYGQSLEHLKKAHMMVSVKEQGGQLLDVTNYHLALLLTREGAFEVAQEIFVRVALSVRNSPEMMFASGLAALRLPILPSEVPADQRDAVEMAGKAFWDLTIQPPEVAEADFKNLVAKYPKFPNVNYFYGTYLGARHPEESASAFLAELKVDPESLPSRVQLALRYITEGKPEEAVKYAREAVKLSPDSVGAQLALGEALRASGDDEHALTAYAAAEKLDPVSPKVRLYMANAYRALGRADDSKREQEEYRRLKAEQQNWP